MRLPTKEECKKLFEAALESPVDWSKFDDVYATEIELCTMYIYAMGEHVDFAIKICKNYDGFLAGMKLRHRGHHEWNIALFDVVEFSRVAGEMFKNWEWR